MRIWRLVRPFKKFIKPKNTDGEAEEKQDKPPSVLRAEFQIPPAVIACYEASQQKNNRHEKLKVGGEILALFFVAFSAVATWKAATAARDAAEIAQQTLVVSERPWVTADVAITEPLTFNTNGETRVNIRVSLKNVGHSVATGVWADAWVVLLSHKGETLENWEEPRKVRNEICERARQNTDRGPHAEGFILFPGQQVMTGRGDAFGKEEIEKKMFTFPNVSGRVIQAALGGCVDYRSTFAPEPHVTGFAYWIYSSRGHKDLLPVDELLPVESISLQPYAWAGGYID